MRRPAALLLLLAGCSSYEAAPLDEKALLQELRAIRLELPADGLDADQAVATALLHNPDLQVWRREHEIAADLVISEGAWTNPELRLSFQNLYSRLMNPFLFATDIRFFPAVPGEISAKVARAEAREKRVLAEIEGREAKIAAETRIAHARAVMLGEKLRIVQAAERLHQRVANIVSQRLVAAAATRLDEVLASLKREEIANELQSLAWEQDSALAELGSLLGASVGTSIKVRRKQELAGVPDLAQDRLEDEALRGRPDLRALREEYEEREQGLRLSHLAHTLWPRFLQPGIEKLPSNPSAQLSAAFELPIFDSGGAGIAVAEARRSQAREAFTARLHAACGEIHQALLKLREEERRRRYYADRVGPFLSQAEEVVKSALEAGEVDALKLVSIETRLLDARRESVQAQFEYERARVQLALATGSVLRRQ